VVEQRAAGEEALLVAGDGEAAAVGGERRAVADARGDVRLDARLRVEGDERPHLGVALHAVLDDEPGRALGEQRHDPVGDVADQHRDRDRHAALAGRAVRRADQRIDRLLEVGVGHHDHVVLGAAERLHALAVLAPVS
jgi:hypothetical protein